MCERKETSSMDEKADLIGLVWLHNERVAWRSALLHAAHDDHKAVRRGLRPNVDAWVLALQQVLDERGLPCMQASSILGLPARCTCGACVSVVQRSCLPVEYWPSRSTEGFAWKSLSFRYDEKKSPNLYASSSGRICVPGQTSLSTRKASCAGLRDMMVQAMCTLVK